MYYSQNEMKKPMHMSKVEELVVSAADSQHFADELVVK
jgi:hypothetical protein